MGFDVFPYFLCFCAAGAARVRFYDLFFLVFVICYAYRILGNKFGLKTCV